MASKLYRHLARNFFRSFLAIFLFTTSCKKDKTDTLIQGTILLSQITDNNPTSATYGLALAQFSYNGKQLSKAVRYNEYTNGTSINATYPETELFNYDAMGNLTGTTITNADPAYTGDVRSVITYTGNNISEVVFYKAGNVPDQDILLTYQNGNLISWSNYTYPVSTLSLLNTTTYTYDSNNNNTGQKNTYQEYYITTTSNYTFDAQKNVTQALPFWIYFLINNQIVNIYIPTTPGTNNVLTAYVQLPQFGYYYDTDSYSYSAYNFPVASNIGGGGPYGSFKYDYIVVP